MQEFDMISGSSTDGLIAITLGRFRIAVKECINAYASLSRETLTPKRLNANLASHAHDKLNAERNSKPKPIEYCIKQIIHIRNLPQPALPKDYDQDAPKAFVYAVRGSNPDAIVIRPYKSLLV